MVVTHRRLLAALAATTLIALVGCSGGAGADVSRQPPAAGDHASSTPSGGAGSSGSSTKKGSGGQPARGSHGSSGDGPTNGPTGGGGTSGTGSSGGSGRSTPSAKQQPVLNRLPGSARLRCVAVGSGRDVRSGSMAGGPFDDARGQFRRSSVQVPTVRLYWIPAHGAASGGSRVTATRLSPGPAISRSVTQRQVSTAGHWSFYDTEIPIASPGTWRFKVSAGSDRGCFIVDFHR